MLVTRMLDLCKLELMMTETVSTGVNLYAYVQNVPLDNIDPSGHDSVNRYTYPDTFQNAKSSDYYHLAAGYYIGTVDLVLTKSGQLFFGGGISHPDPKTLVSGKVGLTITAGNLLGENSPQQVDSFVGGMSTGAAAFYGVGGGYSVNGSGKAVEIGFGSPGFSVQPFDYLHSIVNTGMSWK